MKNKPPYPIRYKDEILEEARSLEETTDFELLKLEVLIDIRNNLHLIANNTYDRENNYYVSKKVDNY